MAVICADIPELVFYAVRIDTDCDVCLRERAQNQRRDAYDGTQSVRLLAQLDRSPDHSSRCHKSSHGFDIIFRVNHSKCKSDNSFPFDLFVWRFDNRYLSPNQPLLQERKGQYISQIEMDLDQFYIE